MADNLHDETLYNELDILMHHNLTHSPHMPLASQDDMSASSTNNHSATPVAHPSTSYIPPTAVEAQSGIRFLQELLLEKKTCGITASPFLAMLASMQTSASLHGITVYGLSLDDYKCVLLRHIFAGACVDGPNVNDWTACHHFAQGFISAEHMSRSAFDIIQSASVTQRATQELLFLSHSLGFLAHFEPQRLRQQIIHEFKRCSLAYASATVNGQEFSHFEKHDKSTLLSIALSHQISVDSFTSTKQQLKTAIMRHFVEGQCCHTIKKIENVGHACKQSVRTFVDDDDLNVDVEGDLQLLPKQFIVNWLSSQLKTLSPAALQRVLDILELKYNSNDRVKELRTRLKPFITRLESKMPIQLNGDIEKKLEQLHREWPTAVTQTLKDKFVMLFREKTSSAALSSVTRASCAENCLVAKRTEVKLSEIDISVLERPDHQTSSRTGEFIVDSTWMDCNTVPPTFAKPVPTKPNALLDPNRVSVSEDGEFILSLCKTCHSSIKNNKVPPLALANHMFLGDVPEELKDLTVVKEAMIARCRAKCWIVQLKEESNISVPNSQRGVKGHIIIYPQRPSAVATILPPSLEEVSTPICVIFVRSLPSTKEWLEKKAKPLTIRREKVRHALI